MSHTRPLCVYHDGCSDGLMAAAVVDKKYKGKVDYYPGRYGYDAPQVENREIIVVDFSYKWNEILSLLARGNSVTILDHHKTAIEHIKENINISGMPDTSVLKLVLDDLRSGAGIAWDYFYPDKPRPLPVTLVEDRDLWKLEHPHTMPFHYALQLVGRKAGNIDQWAEILNYDDAAIGVMVANGQPIKRYVDIQVAKFIERSHWMEIVTNPDLGQRTTLMAQNCPPEYASDVAGALAEISAEDGGMGVGISYYLDGKNAHISLRSRGDIVDVSAIAENYGGGGHMRAAGFIMPYEDMRLFKHLAAEEGEY